MSKTRKDPRDKLMLRAKLFNIAESVINEFLSKRRTDGTYIPSVEDILAIVQCYIDALEDNGVYFVGGSFGPKITVMRTIMGKVGRWFNGLQKP